MNSIFDEPMVELIKQSMETAVIDQTENESKFDFPDGEDSEK